MSFRQTIARYFSDHAETNDVHMDPSLKTHYYKTTAGKGISMLENLFQNNPKYRINAVSKDRGEMSASIVKGKKAIIVATVTMFSPHRTSIDFSVTNKSDKSFDICSV